jgi:deoxyribodipyrimidine photo-lyase
MSLHIKSPVDPRTHVDAALHTLGVPPHLRDFPPTREAALARADALIPAQYARTRNALDGAVTGLSPYLTHGILSLPELAQRVAAKHRLSYDDKLVFELGWRAFFHHVWSRVKHPDDILRDMRPDALPQLWRGRYASELPADIREGRTGVPAIDAAVRQLYATGYIHNHARMWLASYVVHLRKVHWRAGADWLYAHLLDGDLPSNHLSWQWVASSFSSKPYLFNASNVAKFAPATAWKAWQSNKTAIDLSYDELDIIAREQGDVGPEPGVHAGIDEPTLWKPESPEFLKHFGLWAHMESASLAIKSIANDASRHIELVHPWSLSERRSAAPHLRIGIVHTPAHTRWPWSERRWRFVLDRMQAVCDHIVIGDVAQLLAGIPKGRLAAQHTRFEAYRDLLPRIASITPEPQLFPNPETLCGSFTRFYERVRREQSDFSKLL